MIVDNRRKISLPDGYEYDRWFIRQSAGPSDIYDADYKKKQSTNALMSYMRIGWLSHHFSVEEIWRMKIVDVGSGNGEFARCCVNAGMAVVEYDLSGDSISRDELYGTAWDLVVLSDVLEHFDDIDELFRMKWRYCMLSFPETPDVADFEELKTWRHFKPGEHIYHLYRDGVTDWVNSMEAGAEVISCSNVEDLIRTRWDDSFPNITTMLIHRQSCEQKNGNL